MQDIQFWFKRKSIPRTEDEGLADVEITGEVHHYCFLFQTIAVLTM